MSAVVLSVVAVVALLIDHSQAAVSGLRVGACYAPGSKLPDSESRGHGHAGLALASGDFVTSGEKWPGTPAVVTYSFATAEYSLEDETGEPTDTVVPLDTFMPTGFKAEIVRAFDAWAAVANIQFVEVPDNGEAFNDDSATGDIRIGGHVFDGPRGTLAHAFFPTDQFNAAGDIHFDADEEWEVGQDGTADNAFDIFLVALHEIGHSIGLDHSQVADAVMAPIYNEAVGAGLRPDDIAGAVQLYGARVTSTVAQALGNELAFCTRDGFLFSGPCDADNKKRATATGNQRVTIQTNLIYKRLASRDGCSLQASVLVDGQAVWKSGLETLERNSVNAVALVDLADGEHTARIDVKLRRCRGVKFALADLAIVATKIADIDEIEIDGDASFVIVGGSSSSSSS